MNDPSPRTTESSATLRRNTPLQAVGGAPGPGRRIMPWEAITVASAANLMFAAILGVVLAAGAGVLVLRQTPVYQSQATLLIDQPAQIALGQNDGVLVKLALLRNRYVALATSSQLLGPASQATGIPITELAAVRMTAPPNSLLILSVSRGGDRATTQNLANVLADQLSKYATKEQTDAGVPPPDQITITTIRPAGAGAKIRPTSSHARSVGMVAGGAGVLSAYVVLQVATARRRLQD